MVPKESDDEPEPVVRVALDRRPPASTGPTYPGLRAAAKKHPTIIEEARSNIDKVWLGRYPSRYSDGSWPVLYTAKRIKTSYAEVGYHLQEFYLPSKKPGTTIRVRHIRYSLTLTGRRWDYEAYTSNPASLAILCVSDTSKQTRCRDIARAAIARDVRYLKVPSARAERHFCFPVLAASAASPPRGASELEIEVPDTNDHVIVHLKGRRLVVRVSRRY